MLTRPTPTPARLHAKRARLPRILVVTPIYPWPGNPAEGIFVQRQIENLARLGHECRVLAYRGAVPGLPRGATSLSWLRYHPRWLTWPHEQNCVPTAHSFFARERGADVVPQIAEMLTTFMLRHPEYLETDVVYAHWLWTGGAVGIRLGRRFGWPVAAIARGSDMYRWQSMHPHCRNHVDDVLADADLLLANCDALRGRIQETNVLAGQRARVVYNGCDASAFRPARDQRAVRGRLGLAPHRRYLLTCATVARHKGMSELAAAWKIFSPRHPEWRLLVAGQVVERDQAALLRRSAQGTVSILGPVASGQVAAYMQAADAYVQPSRQEGLSNATMEAMACGLPVISTDAGGQGEVVTDQATGWLIPGGDYRALLGAMFELVADAEHARRLGQAARRRIESDFRPPASTRRLSGMLATLAAGGAVADEHEHLEHALGDLASRRAVGA